MTNFLVTVPVGNKHICRPAPVWTADHPMIRGQLLSKRDDFWETSPLYGGKPEIWQVSSARIIRKHSNVSASRIVDTVLSPLALSQMATFVPEVIR